MKPTPRGIYVALAGFLFALLPVLVDVRFWTFWPIFTAWMTLAFGLDALLSPRRSGMTFEAELPEALFIGEADMGRLTVRFASPTACPIVAAVDFSDHLAPQPRLRGRCRSGECRVDLPLVPRRRGTSRIETLWVRFTGPLGLVASTARLELNREIPVVPNTRPVRAAAIRFHADRESRAGLKIEQFAGDGTEFDSLKEFVRGDDSRAIDWKASARHLKLLSRQFRAERDHQVILAVDSGHLMAELLGGIPKLDHALNVALLLAYIGLTSGDRVGLFSFDARVGLFIEPQGGMRALWAITRMSSRVQYSDAETNFTLGLMTLAQRVRRRSLIVVLTDFVDTVTAELMLDNLERLSRRHLVVFVALRDPRLARVAEAPPLSAEALNRAVVAQNFVRDREVVLRRLRRMGVRPIDAEPSRVGPALINSYLEIKRREMI